MLRMIERAEVADGCDTKGKLGIITSVSDDHSLARLSEGVEKRYMRGITGKRLLGLRCGGKEKEMRLCLSEKSITSCLTARERWRLRRGLPTKH